MTGLASTREALLAEALGELGTLLDRVEAAVLALKAAGAATDAASERMARQAEEADRHILALVEGAKVHTARHIAAHAARAMRQASDAEVERMTAAARALFREELVAALRQQVLARQETAPFVLSWKAALWTHLAACATASLATWALVTL